MTQKEHSAALDQRYGRSSHRRWDKTIAWVAAGAAVLGGVAFLATGGLNITQEAVSGRDITHSINGTTGATLTYEVTAPKNTPVACAIEALSESFAPVAYSVQTWPAANETVTSHTVTLNTVAEATTITVKDCWALETRATSSTHT